MGDFHPTSEQGADSAREAIDELRAEFRVQKITHKYIVRKLKQGLNAGITKVFHSEGAIYYSRKLIDYQTRVKYLDVVLKLEDLYPANKVETKHEGTIYHDLSKRMEKAIEATEDAIRNDRKPDRKPKRK